LPKRECSPGSSLRGTRGEILAPWQNFRFAACRNCWSSWGCERKVHDDPTFQYEASSTGMALTPVQTTAAKPSLNPLFYLYPPDSNTFAIDGQFFYAVLVSPRLEENSAISSTTEDNGFSPVRGNVSKVTFPTSGSPRYHFTFAVAQSYLSAPKVPTQRQRFSEALPLTGSSQT
jgi:hypothetical protein